MKGQQGRLAQEKRNQIVTCLLSDNYGATQDTNKRNNSLLEQENCHSKLLEKKTNLSSSTVHVNVQQGKKVMTVKNKKYPKMD